MSSKKKQTKQLNKSCLINCAYCRGKGVDPFGIPSKLSRCQVCQGRGRNVVPKQSERCVACLGTGVYKHHRLPCAVCKGKGQVRYIASKDRRQSCTPENDEMLDLDTGLPCISAYDF